MTHLTYELAPNATFATYNGATRHGAEHEGLGGHLLIRVSDHGRLEDHFRVVLSGSEDLSATFTANTLTQNPSLDGYTFSMEVAPENIELRNNSFTSKWQDLESLVAGNKILVSHAGKQDATADFRADWDAARTSDIPVTAALRWTVQAHAVYGFKLSLQALPSTARSLRKDARLCADTTRAWSWPPGLPPAR